MRSRVAIDHRAEPEPRGDLRENRHAELPAPVGDHEGDSLGRNLLGRRDEITLVFPVFIVDDDDDPPFLESTKSVVNLGDFVVHGRFLARKTSGEGRDRQALACVVGSNGLLDRRWFATS